MILLQYKQFFSSTNDPSALHKPNRASKFYPMIDSSDSDIIDRTRHSAYVSTRKRYDSESTSTNDLSHGYGEIFYSLFGSGNEYAYIYENNTEEDTTPIQESQHIDIDACFAFVQKEIPPRGFSGFSKQVVTDIINGFAPEYIAIYHNSLTAVECYYIQDTIAEFTRHAPAAKSSQEYESVEGLLPITQYIENLRAGERIYEPKGSISTSFGWDEDDAELLPKKYRTTISALSSHPVFIAAVTRSRKFERMGVNNAKDVLVRFYSTESVDESNEVRSAIIEEASKLVSVDVAKINKDLLAQGMISNESESHRFDPRSHALQTLANAIHSLQGPIRTYAGLFLDKSVCKAVVLNEHGEVTHRASFRANEHIKIHEFIPVGATTCLTSNTPAVRYFIHKVENPMFYVPLSFSLFPEEGAYSVPTNIARAVQNPLVYFSRFALSNPSLCPVYRRAISIASSIIKPDWTGMYNYASGSALFEILGIPLSNEHFDYAGVRSFDDLRTGYDDITFANIGTFFSLSSSSNLLDGTHVHPKDYSWATVVCRGACDRTGEGSLSGSQVVQNVLENPRLLHQLALPDEEVSIPNGMKPSVLRTMLLDSGYPLFEGATDQQIFCDVVPALGEGSSYDGVVFKEGDDFYLVDANGATVYVRKDRCPDTEFSLNQIVKIKITNTSYHMLSFGGEILAEPGAAMQHFARHRLYHAGDQQTVEAYIRDEGMNVLVRGSSSPSCCVVICRIEDYLFFSYRLHEGELDGRICYRYYENVYESLDIFVQKFVAGVYQLVQCIRNFKYFYNSREEAFGYLREPGKYVKYAICFSRKNPGFIEFLYGSKQALARVDGDGLQFKDLKFSRLEEFLAYAKQNFS